MLTCANLLYFSILPLLINGKSLLGLYSVRWNEIFQRKKSKNKKRENILKKMKLVYGEVDETQEKCKKKEKRKRSETSGEM